MAHVKLTLKEEMLTTELPELDVFASRLPRYFPTPLRERFTPEIRTHQLRREIVTTMLINDLVDTGGISYAFRITEDVGVGPIDAIRTYVATDAIFGVGHIWRRIRATDIPVELSDRHDAGHPSADRPRRTLAAQLPSTAVGGRCRNQPVRRQGQGADTADAGVAAR